MSTDAERHRTTTVIWAGILLPAAATIFASFGAHYAGSGSLRSTLQPGSFDLPNGETFVGLFGHVSGAGGRELDNVTLSAPGADACLVRREGGEVQSLHQDDVFQIGVIQPSETVQVTLMAGQFGIDTDRVGIRHSRGVGRVRISGQECLSRRWAVSGAGVLTTAALAFIFMWRRTSRAPMPSE